ncbi:MAG: hypothetical protein V1813_01880 [Candidatus Aenigmatarchaeota archaeon]
MVNMTFEMRKLMEFIGKTENAKTYLHNTKTREAADNIINEGFQFPESLNGTTDMMINTEDSVEMNWWYFQRKDYGIYTVAVQIAKPVLRKYASGQYGSGHLLPENLLSAKDRFFDDNQEKWIFTLSPQYVKGYFNRDTNEGCENPRFNPYHDNEGLAMLNAERFKNYR